MEGSANIFQTMQSIMAVKTKELAKKRDGCKALREQLTLPLEKEADPRLRVRLLLGDAGRRVMPETGKVRRKDMSSLERKTESAQHQEILELAGISAQNVQRMLDQAAGDPAVSPALFRSVEEKFVAALTAQEVKYKYATLFSALVNDSSPGRSAPADGGDGDSIASSGPGFESVGRSEMHEQRETWESLVFTAHDLDQHEIAKKLDQAFGTKEAKNSLYELRKSIGRKCQELLVSTRIDNDEVESCIAGLIGSDLLSQQQNDMLKELRGKPDYLSELADVLGLRITDIDSWSWNTDAIPVEMRRQLNGKYRVFAHEEITQAIFVYYIGVKFSIAFKEVFQQYLNSDGWRTPHDLDQHDRAAFAYFIGNRTDRRKDDPQINKALRSKFEAEYFMSVLPGDMDEVEGCYSAEDATNNDDARSQGQRSVEAKQALLHLMMTEAIMADQFGESLHVLQTDFRWFGPSLSHSAIAAVLKYFGVTEKWLRFFEKFLKAPMKFLQDGPDAQIRVRQCGIPMSHILSTMFGESVMFCLDVAVNEATGGRPMFRMHDDIWVWGNTAQCAAAWKALIELSEVLGIKINQEKTGSARLTSTRTGEKKGEGVLPAGALTWGFLTIRDGGKIDVEEKTISKHIAEFRRQLDASTSVMGWVRAYNAYARFIAFNLCAPSNSLGRAHVDRSLDVFAAVHKALFPDTNGSVAEHVKRMIGERYGVNDVPDGFIFLPMTLGGLELHNPCIALASMRENVDTDPRVILEEAVEDDRLEYERLRESFEKHGPTDRRALKEQPAEFMKFEDYSRFRREQNNILTKAWSSLMKPASEEHYECRPEVEKLLQMLPTDREYSQFRYWDRVTPYWQGVFDLYSTEMAQIFGGLEVVGRSLLPLGMVNLLKGRVRWES